MEPRVIGIVYIALRIAMSVQCNDARLVFLCLILHCKIELDGLKQENPKAVGTCLSLKAHTTCRLYRATLASDKH